MSRHRTLAEQAVAQLLSAYRKGFFPMADVRTGEIHWHNPTTRGVIPITAPGPRPPTGEGEPVFHVPVSLRQRVRSGKFIVTSDRAFTATIVGCADPNREGAWIDETIIRTYRLLHDAGHAHSIEAWLPDPDAPVDVEVEPPSRVSPAGEAAPEAASTEGADAGRTSRTTPTFTTPMRLVGGLYGVSIGSAFFGESMFSKPGWGGADASKVCLVHLVAHLRRRGYTLLDTQMWSWHLEQFGCEEVAREEFLPLLEKACRKRSVTWGEFEALATDGDSDEDMRRSAKRVVKRLPGK